MYYVAATVGFVHPTFQLSTWHYWGAIGAVCGASREELSRFARYSESLSRLAALPTVTNYVCFGTVPPTFPLLACFCYGVLSEESIVWRPHS